MARIRLKPLSQQTIVITGASSGIGLATARAAAQAGAAVFLIARNEEALSRIVEELRGRGARADHYAADVGKLEELEAAAKKAEEVFGGYDSWVNDAGTSVYGELEKLPLADHHRLFETNYWGVVHGSTIAARALRRRGGAIVNIGSVLSDRSMILQGAYSATKHAVRAFTDALRMELERDGAPISVTLIKPSGIETPFQEHAKNLLDSPGVRVPPPAYDPRLVARAILYACEHRKREIVVGFGGHAISLMGTLFPRATDLVLEAVGYGAQTTRKRPKPARADNLHAAREDGTEKSLMRPVAPLRRTSLFLEAQLHPALTATVLAGLGALAAGALAARGQRRIHHHRWH
ncbi:SDR family NAD(P)-dependent oxidoreductase [Siccirubricoccus sp. KC 17139]|uniref:SDR family NAD(P)-dependent oxidoreductase n=1 Tax=Siccirubricoccus soli TaxID=2899147 RepID=A0ABT1CYJ0_9PROT|nr:SDR family oxidoreductase [Siccirubricoccus soli]MCO6414732.1 SDR family NAD(P)-dependent oxidoreductase [Siccirubricoccus soli]MCP2680862.1 SDR family oxidoreductase [Siccirubricoccus soli]